MTEPRFKDDRTAAQRETHTVLYGGVDTFLSKWGPPADAGVKSRAYWACRPEDCDKVRTWVNARSDIARPSEATDNVRRQRTNRSNPTDFVHVYAVNPGHPALD